MEQLRFKIKINAPKEKVWNVLWNDNTYPRWTRAFSEGSRAISDWNEGSKITFLNGENDGMYSIIDKKVENEQIVFKHMGLVQKGVELPSVETKIWAGTTEAIFLMKVMV